MSTDIHVSEARRATGLASPGPCALPMFARNEQRALPHRRHHHPLIAEALSSLSFTARPRNLLPAHFAEPPPPQRYTWPLCTTAASYSMASVRRQLAALPPALPSPSPPAGPPAHTDCLQQAPNQPRPYPGNYLPNGGAPSGPVPGAVPLLPNQGRVLQQGSVRVLCIADVRGRLTP